MIIRDKRSAEWLLLPFTLPTKRKRSFLTVNSRCYRRCESLSGVLISSVKTSSVNALPIARSRRVSTGLARLELLRVCDSQERLSKYCHDPRPACPELRLPAEQTTFGHP